MNEKNIKKAYEFLIDECKKLLNGEFHMDQFTVSKTSIYINDLSVINI
jgi:hypothetical protein